MHLVECIVLYSGEEEEALQNWLRWHFIQQGAHMFNVRCFMLTSLYMKTAEGIRIPRRMFSSRTVSDI